MYRSVWRPLWAGTLTARSIAVSSGMKKESSRGGKTYAARKGMKFIFRHQSQNFFSNKSDCVWSRFSSIWRWFDFLIWLYYCWFQVVVAILRHLVCVWSGASKHHQTWQAVSNWVLSPPSGTAWHTFTYAASSTVPNPQETSLSLHSSVAASPSPVASEWETFEVFQ